VSDQPKLTIVVTRRDDGGFTYTADSEGLAIGGGQPNGAGLLRKIEDALCAFEDRCNGGSGLL
jgi:hypothetical protein